MLPAFLLGASLEYGSGSAQAPCPVGPPAEVHYSPGENLETIDVDLWLSALDLDRQSCSLASRMTALVYDSPRRRSAESRLASASDSQSRH